MSETVVSSLTPRVFDFQDHAVRILGTPEQPWFVAADVCRVLDLGNVTEALRSLDDDERMTLSNPEGHSGQRGGAQSFNVISEAGLYSLIFRSRKPQAKAFKRWVTHEVLPAIRKTGRYELQAPSSDLPELKLSGLTTSQRLEVAQCWLLEAMASFMAGKLSTRRLNAVSKAVARLHEGLDRKWKREERDAQQEREQEDLLELIDRVLFADGANANGWEGRSSDLEAVLLGKKSPVREAALKVCGYNSAMGQALARVQKVAPDRVRRRTLRGYTYWAISSPAAVTGAEEANGGNAV